MVTWNGIFENKFDVNVFISENIQLDLTNHRLIWFEYDIVDIMGISPNCTMSSRQNCILYFWTFTVSNWSNCVNSKTL